MKGIGVLLVLVGIALFVLPLFRIVVPFLVQLGNARTMLSVVLILIGSGLFFFSSDI